MLSSLKWYFWLVLAILFGGMKGFTISTRIDLSKSSLDQYSVTPVSLIRIIKLITYLRDTTRCWNSKSGFKF
jgi:hypothetical protein